MIYSEINNSNYECAKCGKKYTKKHSLADHYLLCNLKTQRGSKIEEEEASDIPTYKELVTIVQHLNTKCLKLERQMESVQNILNRKTKPINVVEWMNANLKPNMSFEEWARKITVSREHLDELILNKNILGCIQKSIATNMKDMADNEIPIRCFKQNKNTVYVYTSNIWIPLATNHISKILHKIQMGLLDESTSWMVTLDESDQSSNCYNTTLQLIMKIEVNTPSSASNVQLCLSNGLAINVQNMIPREFEFNNNS